MYNSFDCFQFGLDLDIDFEKSSKQKDFSKEERYKNMTFSGLASDKTEDAEDEVLDPNGFIYDRFLKSGLFNLDHLPTRSPINKSRFWIGEPLEAKVRDGKFFVKGKLWENSPEARAFWDKAIEMKESGSTRKPGMSVEGKALARDPKNPKRVTKALITNIALTFTPVNPSTYVDITKSMKSRDIDFNSPKDFQTQAILLEYNSNGKVIQIDRDFKISVKYSPSFQVEQFWDLYKGFQKGFISKKVLDDFLKKSGRIIL